MSEEVENTNDGTWSGLKKTFIGILTTIMLGAGTYVTTLITGGDKEEAPVQQAPVININNTQTQQQSSNGGGKTIIIKEKSTPATAQPVVKPVKKKEGDEFKEEEPKW